MKRLKGKKMCVAYEFMTGVKIDGGLTRDPIGHGFEFG
jgi:hypothetical protein